MGRRIWGALAGAVTVGACFGSGSAPSGSGSGSGPSGSTPPITLGHWTYYGTGQGLSADVRDVSPDEGGNVYVAGGDALYAKQRAAPAFLRFDAQNAGLTKNCNDHDQIMNPAPTTPFHQCAVLAVGGASPGKAIVGYEGLGADAEGGADWALEAGGADVVQLDPSAHALTRARHVFLASPPHVVCGTTGEAFGTSCSDPLDYWWVNGRRKFHSVWRIVVNHDHASPMYGDAWLGGTHATFAALLDRAADRGWVDKTAGWGTAWADAKDVWEHLHPAITGLQGELITGDGYALSIDPRTGIPWGSNGLRVAWVDGYGPDLAATGWGLAPGAPGQPPYIDLWPDPPGTDPVSGPGADMVRGMSHCPDGTLWIGSLTHGLARIYPSGAISTMELPDARFANSVTAVSCDPSDGTLWVGLGKGGVARLRGGVFEWVAVAGAPEFAAQPVASIQIDHWSSGPRVVYFAFAPVRDANGAVVKAGGVAAYDGP